MLKENKLPSLADKIIAKSEEAKKNEVKTPKNKKLRGISRASTTNKKIKGKK